MRIALLALGTRGDIEPIVALGAELRRRGHDTVLGVSVNLVDIARRLGLDAVPIGWDTQRVLESAQGRAWVAAGDAEAFTHHLFGIMNARAEQLDTETAEVCAGADAIVTAMLLETRGAAIAEARGIPLIVDDPFPRRPNGVVPHPLVTTEPLPTADANLATYRQFARLAWRQGRYADRRFRMRLGLPPDGSTRRPALELQTYSPLLVPGLFWDELRPFVGNLRLTEPDLHTLGLSTLDPELAAWLAAGPPPAFFAFGSTFTRQPSTMVDTIVRVCRALGLRAVICAGWGLTGSRPQPADWLRVVSYVNYDAILRHCAIVVHHGSAPITASGARAGIPTMVCSSFADQPFWGTRLHRLGVGVHVRFHELTESVLRAGMARLLEGSIRDRAAELGRQSRVEPHGTLAAADRIDTYLAEPPDLTSPTTAHSGSR